MTEGTYSSLMLKPIVAAEVGRSCLAGCIEAYVRTSSKPEEQFIRKILLSMGAIAVGGPVVGISKGMDRQSFLRGLTNQLRANWDYAEGKANPLGFNKVSWR